MPRILIAIVDILANDILGPVQVFPHPAPAIRMFSDVCKDERTQIYQHIEDHHLVKLGTLEDDLTITPAREVLITGAQWKAVNTINEAKQNINLQEEA